MKTKLARTLSIILMAVMVMSLLAACQSQPAAPSSPSTPSTPTVSTQPVKLSLLMTNTENRDGIDPLIAKIEQDLNIITEIELRPGGAEGENIVRSRLAVNEVSDIMLFNSGSLMGTLNPTRNFYDLKDKPYINTFSEAYLQTVTFNGGTYGIPLGATMLGGWLYNKEVYKELGLSVPRTWEELMNNCQKIKDAGKTAVIASFGNDWTSQLILLADYYNVQQADPSFAENFNSNKAKFATNPAAFRAFEKMREVYDKGFLNPDYHATTLDVALKMLVDGDGVHYPMLSNQFSNIERNYGFDAANSIGFFGQPGENPNDRGVTVWMPNSFMFYKDSPRIEAALKWAEYWVKPESVEFYATKRLPQGPPVVKGASLPANTFDAIKNAMTYFDAGRTAPALEFITSVKGPNAPQICIMALGGLASAKEAAEEYDKDVAMQAKQLGLPGW